VADEFLDKGVIVSTVGASEGRDEKSATQRGTEPSYPIVVLVNGASASASEIVAGALKNHNRAVVVGQSTFGKGTVQLVFPRITPDGAALKLTIAQYLPAGNTSIQGVGVVPDIELDPMTADMLEMDLYRSDRSLRERDLSKSLSHNGERRQERPTYKLRYNLPETERAKIREQGGDLDDEFQLDFPISFARDLAQKLSPGPRQRQLKDAKAFVAKAQEDQIDAVSRDLQALGIDWSPPPEGFSGGPTAKDFAIKVATDKPKNEVDAGEPLRVRVTLTNNSKAPAYQVRAITKSDAPYFDEKELLFGRIGPGESQSAEAPLGWCDLEGRTPGSTRPLPQDAKRVCELPKDAVTRQEVVKLRFFAEGSEAPGDSQFLPTIKSLERPVFAYSYQVADNRPGNGDGQLARGEGATIYLTVKNVGKGASLETQANVRNLTGDGILLRAGRFDVSNMKPGDVRNVEFTFDVLDTLAENLIKVELSVSDRDLRVASREKLTMPITRAGLHVNAARGAIKLSDRAGVRAQPLAASPIVGYLPKGSVVARVGSFGDFEKVTIDGSRFGFVESKRTASANARGGQPAYQPELVRSPPLVEVIPAKLATRSKTVEIEGKATDLDGVMDAYIFVGTRKVFYRANQGKNKSEMKFKVKAQLHPGVNMITVVARENEDTATRHTMVVRRDGPNGEALPTPKSDLFGSDWEFVEGD
jgi:carboxyl-terminal processing protease